LVLHSRRHSGVSADLRAMECTNSIDSAYCDDETDPRCTHEVGQCKGLVAYRCFTCICVVAELMDISGVVYIY
jgi:hypothetical protein